MAQYLQKVMKKLNVIRLLFMMSLCLVASGGVWAQTTESQQISAAILSGNARALGTYFNANVDLAVLSTEDVYSKEQAELITARFFSENRPQSFELKHQGKSRLNDYFYIGDLATERGRYRLTFFLRKEGDVFRIKQLRIEPGD
jgi:hypothetical protein